MWANSVFLAMFGRCIVLLHLFTIVTCIQSSNKTSSKCSAIDMAVFNGSYIFWRNRCAEDPRRRVYIDDNTCTPRCNLALHAQTCTSDASEAPEITKDLCLAPNDVCKTSGFWCSKYDIRAVSAAANFCLSNAATINQCSNLQWKSSRSCASPKILQHFSSEVVTTDTCRNLNMHLATKNVSMSSFPSIPITEADLRVLSGDQESKHLHYVKTYTADEKILNFLRHSLFDPHMIILKDFRGCANSLLGRNGIGTIVLYLPKDGHVIELGRGNIGDDRLHVCTSDDYDVRLTIRTILMAIGISMSILSLTATIASLLLAGEHKSVPGVNIICLSASLMTTYITVLVVKQRDIGEDCLPEGIIHVFAVLASVCWMSVMAYDIYSTLSAVRHAEEYSKRSHFRKSLTYCGYGWGLPAAILIVGVLLDHNEILAESYKPRFALACWFTEFNTWGTLIFYHGPIALILISNFVLFIRTVMVLRVTTAPKNSAHNSSLRRGKYLFKLHVKLFVVMGLTWMLEILNLFIPSAGFMTACDFINTMQGFFIFLIFGCKKPVVIKVYNVCTCKADSAHSKYYSYSSKYAPNAKSTIKKSTAQCIDRMRETRI